jgi:hypothetical protein
LAVAFFAGAFLAEAVEVLVDFFAGVDFLAAELLDVFLAVDLGAGDFLAVVELDDFLVGFDVVVFLAVEELEDFFAGLDFAVLVFFAGDFFAVVFDAVDFEVVDFEAVDFEAVDFEAVDFEAVDFEAVELLADFLALPTPAALCAAAAVLRTAGFATPGVTLSTAARVSLGSFFAPDTTSLSWAPGRNAGTAFF